MRQTAGALAMLCAGAGALSAPGAEIGGRYAVVEPWSTAPAADAETVEIDAHRNAYAVVCSPAAGARRRHGWALREGDRLAASLATGGAAYGVAIYHHLPGGHSWSGPWISSLDGGASVGVIHFEDGPELAGRHVVVCERPGAGSVEGTVDISAAADGYRLTFRLGRAVFYRGVGASLADDCLAVAWSFGSAPELATYQLAANGGLAEQRIAWSPHPETVSGAMLLPVKNDAGTLGPVANLSAADDPATAVVGPATPQVKAWSYASLLRQYGRDGWAARWLEGQLTSEERRWLENAIRRHTVAGGQADADLENRSIGTLIDEERARGNSR